MASVEQQVQSADSVICQNLDSLTCDRGFLSQNVLAQLRNLVEGLIVWANLNDPFAEFHYNQVASALDVVRATAKFRLLARFHALLQASVSHYTLDRDPSERLMLKYYEYLLRTRDLAKQQFGIALLGNLEKFPIDLDPSLREYYEKIAARIDVQPDTRASGDRRDRYYIHGARPFFIDGNIYYEVTFSLAHNRTSKFDRIIGFTDIDITDKYAALLELASDTITVLGQTMPIAVIRSWEVSIRPCEFNNFARLFGERTQVQSNHIEFRNIMHCLTTTHSSLLDLVDMTDERYAEFRVKALENSRRAPSIFPVVDRARRVIRADQPGSRLLRYLMLRMNNQVIRAQYEPEPCRQLSNLRASHGCRPFDTMPFCTSPRGHNPRFADLAESLNVSSRPHELLARRIRNNVEQRGTIYTPVTELEDLGDVDALIARHNGELPPSQRHARRKLARANGYVFMVGYEDDTVTIIEKLQKIASKGVEDHRKNVKRWINANPDAIDDELKSDALQALFERSKVAVVYGAAGTGKSTMVSIIASYFTEKQKLFLAHTNPAVDNLKRRVEAPNAEFSTISKHIYGNASSGITYDVLVIDECSIVSNASLLSVLEKTSFNLLVLVGDVYQIESIEFGNWFGIIRSYIPKESVFELAKPFRTTDEALLTLWDRVRNLDDRIEESLSKNGYSTVLGASLFQHHGADEIVLCLNYDGLYGINNVNRFLQASNPNPVVIWNDSTYKVGDPILFNETDRFRPVIFNNLKGEIRQIDRVPGHITFEVELDRDISESEVEFTDLRWVGGSTVQFDVFERGNTDDDDDTFNTIVPFQIAYAVSIHKAQGLEFDSVKVVITDANEESISHNIFYTAITRARKYLTVFWTPETQHRILSGLVVRENTKDENLLKVRRGIIPVTARQKRQKTRERP
ncbi:AAA family ATPase [Nocardia brasiliensis]|uniref:Helicase n=1 Tax=Nocardia brasiliensis (strain ATCC 700358 / HUJEG-1) TaxID=1133849 RepID=K0FBH8_NOCB7|nr:AAA family ATPase [Nocardia brasiliensis]AFU04771.1 helicase [Nocardia brasiliensis ATCC 700358]OCF88260.1 helicase [Nocardia brasiliensis]